MSRLFMWFLFAAVMVAVSFPAQAKIVGVGGCNPKIKNYPTISAAVGDPTNSGATIQICAAAGPGTGGSYPEQVTIGQPLTLEGVANGNSGRAVISIPSGGPFPANWTSIVGQSVYVQVLVQAHPVNITNITVDGTGGGIGCSVSAGLVGIFYVSGSNGTINEATARNQVSGGCGTGIWAENGSAVSELITIENSSIENMDQDGIFVTSTQQLSTMQVTIEGNSVTASEFPPTAGIVAIGANGKIEDNVVTSGVYGIESISSSTNLLSNVVADIRNSGNGNALYLTPGATATNNNVSDSDIAIYLEPSQATGPTVQGNASMNNITSVEFNCNANTTVQKNRFTDSQKAFNDWPGNTLFNANQFYDIDFIPSMNQCP
jgi:hypothetical protein